MAISLRCLLGLYRVLAYSGTVYGLQCYDCQRCDKVDNLTNRTTCPTDTKQVCYKITLDTVSAGKSGVLNRGCIDAANITYTEDKCESRTNWGGANTYEKATLCACSLDLCNGSPCTSYQGLPVVFFISTISVLFIFAFS